MTILQRIVETKRAEVERARAQSPIEALIRAAARAPAPRDFCDAVTPRGAEDIRLIAEMKRSSPSAGTIVTDYNPAAIARTYERHGAAALSVLTDAVYFDGALAHLVEAHAHSTLPVLRKDFMLEEYQLYESRASGADAVLLIVEAIGIERVAALAPIARDLGMGVIVEVHSEPDLLAVLGRLGPPDSGTYLIGINNRDLTVQRTDLATMSRLSRQLPDGTRFIAESGIQSRKDVLKACKAGAGAVLVGESILRAADMGAKIDELLGR